MLTNGDAGGILSKLSDRNPLSEAAGIRSKDREKVVDKAMVLCYSKFHRRKAACTL